MGSRRFLESLGEAWALHVFARAVFWAVVLAACLLVLVTNAHAQIPEQAQAWRLPLTAFAHAKWGAQAPVSSFAAQVHQESAWRSDAVSPVGAIGLTQFMPATAGWLAKLFPSELAAGDPHDPLWALRALVIYDRWNYDRLTGPSPCDQMAAVLAAFNSGLGWVQRAEKKAGTDRWLNGAERVNPGQSPAAFKESRAYPRRILGMLEPRYVSAGWGDGSCM